MAKGNHVAGLDIGTSKVCAVVGEMEDDHNINVLGMGFSLSKGLRKGVVVNIEQTIEAIRNAVEQAENMAGITVDSMYTGMAGAHISGVNSRGIVGVTRKDKEICQEDLRRVLEAAGTVPLSIDREIVHVLPFGFIVDNQNGVKDPKGMIGVRLEVEVHVVTAGVTFMQTIERSVKRAGFGVEGMVLEPLAAGEAVLTQDEKDLGVVLIDIGGGTTDMVIFVNGFIRHSKVLPLGGDHLTNDISVGLRTPQNKAEEIKRRHGCALVSLVSDDEIIPVPSVGDRGDREVPRRELAAITEQRIDEILGLTHKEMLKTGCKELIAAGVVLTGGTSLLPGIAEMSQEIFEAPVRIGTPRFVDGNSQVDNPIFSTAVGLVHYGLHRRREMAEGGSNGGFWGNTKRLFRWLGDVF